jgi:hypothetical protein
MIDFWEVIGRALTDEEFREAVLGANLNTKAPDQEGYWEIPEKDYETMLAVIRTRMDGPVSLMALGEIIVSLTYATFSVNLRKVAEQIHATNVRTKDRDAHFYVAMGAMVLDRLLRERLRHDRLNHTQFDTYGFKHVSHDERRALLTIFSDQNRVLEERIFAFCEGHGSPWVPDCNDFMVCRTHRHCWPVSYAYETSTTGKSDWSGK